MAFMDFKTKRLGMAFTVSGSPVAPSARFLVAVLFLARETSLNGPTAGFCRAPWRSRGSRSNINHLDELGELHFLLGIEQRDATDVAEEELQEVGR